MIIPEIKLTHEEMCDAVGAYLSTRGVLVPVELVERNYTGLGAFRVTLKTPEEAPAPPESLEGLVPTQDSTALPQESL